MLLVNNADIKQQLLAGSDEDESDENSSIASNVSDFGMSSTEENIESKTEEETKATVAKPRKLSETNGKSCSEDEEPLPVVSLTQQAPVDYSNKAETRKSTEERSGDDELQPKKKRMRRDSTEREIFSKSLLEMNGTNSTKSHSTSTVLKREQKPKVEAETSEDKASGEKDTIDLSMFENKKTLKEADLNKIFEKRANANACVPSTALSLLPAKPAAVINEDEWISLSSDSDSELSAQPSGSGPRIPKRKKMLTEEELQEETKRAQKEETQRVERLKKKNATLSQMLSQRMSQEPDAQEDEVVLDYDSKSKVTIKVHSKLVGYLKDHQKEGIRFMYDTCYGSIADDVKTESGCVLAHW